MKAFLGERTYPLCMMCMAVLFAIPYCVGLRGCAIVSGSMEPTIPTYSLCLVTTDITLPQVEVGDVVVYFREADQRMIVHRVIAETAQGFVTKGDANTFDDGISVTEETLYAKCLCHVPYLGFLFSKPYGLYIQGGVLAICLLGFAVPAVRQKKR